MAYFTRPEEALDYIYNKVKDNKGPLGIGYVGYADEQFLPEYPAVVVSFNNPVDRELLTTQRGFQLIWAIQIIIYHSRLSTDHITRSREDMQFAEAITNLLHQDFRAGGGVIFGYVAQERPGIIADNKGEATVATTLIWTAESRAAF
jgi:hypothetical protein